MKLFGGNVEWDTGVKGSTIIKFILLAAGAFAVVGLLFMALWNWVMPEVFGLKEITFLQGYGLLLLAKLIFSYDNTVKVNRNKKSDPVKVVTKDTIVENDDADEMYEKWWNEEGEAYFETYLADKLESDM